MKDDQSINEWDEYAGDWESNPQVIEYSKLAFSCLKEELDLNGLRVMDFGAGTGLLSEWMSPRVSEIVAIDPSVEMISVLKNKNLPNANAISEELTWDLMKSHPSLSAQFDLIVASSVCGFLPNYKEILLIFRNLLTPRGVLVHWDWLVEQESEIGLTRNEIEEGFKEAGLKLKKLTEAFSMELEGHNMPVIMALGQYS